MRSAYQTKGVRSVTAWALVYDGQHAGTVVTYSADTGGVTATVSAWAGPLSPDLHIPPLSGATHGSAHGGGYDKESAAISDALVRAGLDDALNFAAAGLPSARRWLEGHGYTVFEVI